MSEIYHKCYCTYPSLECYNLRDQYWARKRPSLDSQGTVVNAPHGQGILGF